MQDQRQQSDKQDQLGGNQDTELKWSDFLGELLKRIFQITGITAEIMMGQCEATLAADKILALKTAGAAGCLGMILAVFFFHLES